MTAERTLVLPACSFFDDHSMKPSQGSGKSGNCGIGHSVVRHRVDRSRTPAACTTSRFRSPARMEQTNGYNSARRASPARISDPSSHAWD